MTIIRWNRPMLADMLENLVQKNGHNGHNGELPATNIIENQESFLIQLAAPGRNKENFQLQIDNKVLSISYNLEQSQDEKANTSETYLFREFGMEPFTRSFSLPKKADLENISASYKEGVLNISIPKVKEENLTRSIEIS